MTDYYATVEQAIASGEIRWSEAFEPLHINQIDPNSCPIPVASIAIHGGNIESKSDKFARDLYLNLPSNISQDSAYYTFGTDMNSKESIQVSSERCLRAVCCEKINKKYNPRFDATMCDESYSKRIEDDCESKYVCYENAVHITSTNFTTPKLLEVVKNRFVVSWHGFKERKVGDKYIDVIFGGLFKHTESAAKKFVQLTNGNYPAVFCKGKDDCYTVPDLIPANVKGLEGVHPKNVANLGKLGAGLHIELSNKFRLNNGGGQQELLHTIISTLPKYYSKPKYKIRILLPESPNIFNFLSQIGNHTNFN